MAEICKDIDQGLAALNRKIDEQNRKIRELERLQQQCCKGKQKGNNFDPSAIESRLSKIENYINRLHDDLKLVGDLINEIQSHVEPILKALDGLGSFVLKAATSIIGKFS